MKVQEEEIFLMHHMATILTVCVCVCEQLNIVGFLYLLIPLLYPVLEKTFYSFLVQKKIRPTLQFSCFQSCHSTHSTLFWALTHPLEDLQGSRLAFLSRCGHCLHTPDLFPSELAGSESETVPRRIWESLFLPASSPQTFVGPSISAHGCYVARIITVLPIFKST